MEWVKRIGWVCFFIVGSLQAEAQTFNAGALQLLGRWDDTTIGVNSYWVHSRYNSCIGWSDPSTGHEYAIIGSQKGTHFIDLADPEHLVEVDYVPGRRPDCLWREYKIYSHYVYMVSDDAVPNTFQIADLSYLPDSVHVVYDSDTLFTRAHTIFIDGDKLYGGSVKTLNAAHPMAVYSLANPERPQLLRSLRQDYPHIPIVHDMFVRHDTVYASCAYQGLHIFTFASGTFQALDSFSTANDHYNHSSALSADGHTLYFCEEVPSGSPVGVLNVKDPAAIQLIHNFSSHQEATPHNPYLLGNYLFVAYYQDGLQVFDVSDPLNVTVAGFLDTYPNNIEPGYNDPPYQGAWGAWPYLPSGRVLVSDMNRGLFVVNADSLLRKRPVIGAGLAVFPNPAQGSISVSFGNNTGQDFVLLEVLDITGRSVVEEKIPGPVMNTWEKLDISSLAKGMYLVHAETASGEELGTVKFIKQ